MTDVKQSGDVIGTRSQPSQLRGQMQSSAVSLAGRVQMPQNTVQEVDIATTTTPGIVMVGDNLLIDPKNGRLSVDVANDAEADNTRPITAAAVYTELGNIDILLKII